jgi:hypothetical protein
MHIDISSNSHKRVSLAISLKSRSSVHKTLYYETEELDENAIKLEDTEDVNEQEKGKLDY